MSRFNKIVVISEKYRYISYEDSQDCSEFPTQKGLLDLKCTLRQDLIQKTGIWFVPMVQEFTDEEGNKEEIFGWGLAEDPEFFYPFEIPWLDKDWVIVNKNHKEISL